MQLCRDVLSAGLVLEGQVCVRFVVQVGMAVLLGSVVLCVVEVVASGTMGTQMELKLQPARACVPLAGSGTVLGSVVQRARAAARLGLFVLWGQLPALLWCAPLVSTRDLGLCLALRAVMGTFVHWKGLQRQHRRSTCVQPGTLAHLGLLWMQLCCAGPDTFVQGARRLRRISCATVVVRWRRHGFDACPLSPEGFL